MGKKEKPQTDILMVLINDFVSFLIKIITKIVSFIWNKGSKYISGKRKSKTTDFRLIATDREKLEMTRKYFEENLDDID